MRVSNPFMTERLLTDTSRHFLNEVVQSMPLSWVSAFRRSLVYFLWLVVWSIIGILMMAIGIYVAAVPLSNLYTGKTPTIGTELITGVVLLVLGYLITMLGAIATFIRLIYQLSFEAAQEVLRGKPTAAAPGVAIPTAETKLTPTAVPPVAQPVVQQPTAPAPLPAQQKYCAFCGRPIAVSSRFCPFCQRAQP